MATWNVEGQALMGLYRNNPNRENQSDDRKICTCQYTCLDRIGHDFNKKEILLHLVIRIMPAVKRRVWEYSFRIRRLSAGLYRSEAGSAPVDRRRIVSDGIECGDPVKILPYDEIKRTLNRKRKFKGLNFMAGMKSFCGQTGMVLKEPHQVLDQGGGKIQPCKNVVILEGLYCDGKDKGCDRCCLYYWKKDWLEGGG